MYEFHVGRVDPKYLWDIQEEKFSMETQVSVASQWCCGENYGDS